MTRLIIQHLWSDFKKHWLGILLILGLCYIGTAFALTFGLWFFMIDSQAYLLSDAELKEIILKSILCCILFILPEFYFLSY